MRAISSALLTLLQTGSFVFADCWTITLNGGTVIRWTSADAPIVYGGNTFLKGPAITRGAITEKTGPDVATLDMTINAIATDLVNGTPIIPFIAGHGFDNASVKLERAYAPNWGAAITGSVIRFAGKVTAVHSIQGATVQLTVSSWLVMLAPDMPRNVHQAACLNTLFDSGCTVVASSYSTAGTIPSGGAGQTVTFATSLSSITVNDYALGRILFTSGANNGISRTIKSNTATGSFTLSSPLPHATVTNDAFTAYKGCDLTTGSGGCAKFANTANFRGTPFVPLPRTVIGSASSTVTTQGGKG